MSRHEGTVRGVVPVIDHGHKAGEIRESIHQLDDLALTVCALKLRCEDGHGCGVARVGGWTSDKELECLHAQTSAGA
jgi:hypothetical protein